MSDLHHIDLASEATVHLDGLRIVLLALLPKDGRPRTVAELSANTGANSASIVDALLDDYMAGALEFDVRADAYRLSTTKARPQGAIA
ncbi:hypothetical protein ACVC7V_17380 [Hydrogenophaga sp. A37]|uniref:hypothetical protein n=1 Tax=Hydrogenophaga sp. A37 TaxID=1945864 RepID=UPI00098703EE|nr:hypothetical protein [Hydrogenophaga sp. A37]OOG79192.1 hypothetical protein B0E41_25560 [Hydrogenophaga sp. A37]